MKRLLLFLFVVTLLFSGFACERHPASQTIPSNEEKQVMPSKNSEEK
ncbi:MAG: hypothetical protein ACOYK6_02295 [Chthoniobacterales bacterium]